MKTKKIITTILAFVAVFIISIFINNVDAASLGHVTTIKDRTVDRNKI